MVPVDCLLKFVGVSADSSIRNPFARAFESDIGKKILMKYGWTEGSPAEYLDVHGSDRNDR